MTWSIIARDHDTGQIGIAVATRFFAVGAIVPHIAAGLGAVATQALVNPYYGIDGLRLLRAGRAASRGSAGSTTRECGERSTRTGSARTRCRGRTLRT